MQDLKRHEVFEIEVLDTLNRGGLLKSLVFGGGTMLRLCHELPRYSVDLGFWFFKKVRYEDFYQQFKYFLSQRYELSDAKNKHFTMLYEFKGKTSARKLKIEIRKELITHGTEQKIAYTPQSSAQVLVRTLSLAEMFRRKVEAAKTRGEMRDFFDLEFLLKKGVSIDISDEDKAKLKKQIHQFGPKDFGGVLGALLEKDLRDYYRQNGFSYLEDKLST